MKIKKMVVFRQGIFLAIVLALLLGNFFTGCVRVKRAKPTSRIILATTTSTQDSGLLDFLLPKFEKKYNLRVSVIAVGSGEAINLGRKGDADVLLVHSPEEEEKFIAEGFGINRRKVMQNDFVIIGPKEDPAGIKGMKDVVKAFKRISEVKATFISRGDNSGTHNREKSIWRQANIIPAGEWYVSAGQGMGQTARIADERKAYTLIDRGTYLGLKRSLKLVILVEGAPQLINPYSVIAVNPKKFPRVRYKEALLFIKWITSPDVQKMIGEFGKDKYGQALFTPTAT